MGNSEGEEDSFILRTKIDNDENLEKRQNGEFWEILMKNQNIMLCLKCVLFFF